MATITECIKQLEESLVAKRNKLLNLSPLIESAINGGTRLEAIIFVKLIMEYPLSICEKVVNKVKSKEMTFINACELYNQ